MASINLDAKMDRTRNNTWHHQTSNWFRMCVFILFIIMIVVLAIHHSWIMSQILNFIHWMERNVVIGSISYVFIFSISNVFLVPGSILTLGGGFVYVHLFGLIKGVLISSVIVWFAASLGATLSFLNGRYLFRNIIAHYMKRSTNFALIEQVVQKNGAYIVFLLRLSPLIPFNIFNLVMGITSIKLRDFMIAHPAMFPETVICCFIGGSIAHIYQLTTQSAKGQALLIAFCVIGTVIACCGIVCISRVAKKQFNDLCQLQQLRIPNIEVTEIESLVENEKTKSVMSTTATTNSV
eukprot:531154_1